MNKENPYRNKKLLDFAKGQECQINLPIPGYHDPETVVACHISEYEFGHGKGIKSDDCCIAYCCNNCHDALDGRVNYGFDKEFLRNEFHIANTRTIRLAFRAGIIK